MMTEKRLRNGFVHAAPVVNPKSQVARQHNVSKKVAYVFGNDDMAEMSNENEEIEMTRISHRKPRGRKRSAKNEKEKCIIKEEPVQEGDTLRSFALRYNNQVSDVKRLNCLYNDRDFFALKTAKILIKENSILTQQGELEKRRQPVKHISNESTNSTTTEDDIGLRKAYYSDSCDADESSDNDHTSPEVHLISLKSGLKAKHKKEVLLDVLDNNLQRLKDSVPSTKSTLDEVTFALTQPRIHPLVIPDDYQISLRVKITMIIILIGILITALVIIVHTYVNKHDKN